MSYPAQRIGGRRNLDAGSLQALDHAVPARGVGEGAVDENDRKGVIACCLRHEGSFPSVGFDVYDRLGKGVSGFLGKFVARRPRATASGAVPQAPNLFLKTAKDSGVI